MGIVHRDLKLDNILMRSDDPNNFDILIADFGFATFFDRKEGLDQSLGTPRYMSPEVKKEKIYC